MSYITSRFCTFLLIFSFGFLSLSVASFAQDEKKPISEEDAQAKQQLRLEVQSLVRRLDADDVETRDEAEQAIIAIGPKAAEFFPKEVRSEEVKHRLKKIKEEFNKVRIAAFQKGTVITLKMDDAPLSKVIAALAKQSGNKISRYEGFVDPDNKTPEEKISVEFKDTPFWEALEVVFEKGNVVLYSNDKEGITYTDPGFGIQGPSEFLAAQGSFRLEVTSLQVTKSFRKTAEESHSSQALLSYSLSWEPKINVLQVIQFTDKFAVKDDLGQSLMEEPNTQGAISLVSYPGEPNSKEFNCAIVPPSREAKKIGSFEPEFQVLMPGEQIEFKFDDLTKNSEVTVKHNLASVSLSPIKIENEAFKIPLKIHFDEGEEGLASDMSIDWIYSNPLYLVTPKGDKILMDGYEAVDSQNQKEVNIIYYAVVDDTSLKGYSLLYSTPTNFNAIPLKFNLKDIPLP